jgi:hypothetical protein
VGLEAWAVLSYAEARAALTHPHLLKNPEPALQVLEAAGFTSHLIAGAVEEFLRFDSSVEQSTFRFAAELTRWP